jgi:two-component system response regulator NreC
VRIAIADDHNLVRQGLKAMLADEPSFEFVAEASDGFEAVKIAKESKPDVLLLDLRIPRIHGIEVLRDLQDLGKPHVVVVSMHSDESFLLEALKYGAAGYVLKSSSKEELVTAIRTAASGGQYLCDEVRPKALRASLQRARGGAGQQLTKRELVVLQLASEGHSSAKIGEALFISTRTAEAHRANLMRKLGLKSQTELVLYAVRHGIVTP